MARITTGSPDVDRLVEEHLPLVHRVVGWVTATGVPSHIPRADLTSAGMFGLFQAAAGFDESRGVPFDTYAATRVRGALLDELRSRDWAPRATRVAVRRVEAAREALTARLRRSPDTIELGTELGLDTDELHAVLSQSVRVDLVHLEAMYPESGEAPIANDDPTPELIVLAGERDDFLRDAVATLPARLRQVIEDYYFRERRLVDIAVDLGVTESRVSQLRSQAVALLHSRLANLGEDCPLAGERGERVPALAS